MNDIIGKVALISINHDTNNSVINRHNYLGVILECNPYKNIVMDVKMIYVRDEHNMYPLPEKENKVDMVVSLPYVGLGQYIDSIIIGDEKNNEYIINEHYVYKVSNSFKLIEGKDIRTTRKNRIQYITNSNNFDNSEEATSSIFYNSNEYYQNNPKYKNYEKVYKKTIRRIV